MSDYTDSSSDNFPNDYDPNQVDSRIKLRSSAIRSKMYGKDVREAIAQGTEIAGAVAQSAVSTAGDAKNIASTTNSRLDKQITSLTSDSEVIEARGTYSSLSDRLANGTFNSNLTINGQKPDSNRNASVPVYAPNLLAGTSLTPVQAPKWNYNLKVLTVGNDIEVGQKISFQAYIDLPKSGATKGAAQTAINLYDSSGVFITQYLGNPVAYNLTGFSMCTGTVPTGCALIKIDILTNNADVNTCFSRAKLALWSDPNTPPDMTWVPNTADLDPAGSATNALNSAKSYTDTQLSNKVQLVADEATATSDSSGNGNILYVWPEAD